MGSQGIYEYGEQMANDIIKNHLTPSIHYQDAIQILGKTQLNSRNGKFLSSYLIVEKYGWNMDPMEMHCLRIEFSKDILLTKSYTK